MATENKERIPTLDELRQLFNGRNVCISYFDEDADINDEPIADVNGICQDIHPVIGCPSRLRMVLTDGRDYKFHPLRFKSLTSIEGLISIFGDGRRIISLV